MPPVLGGSVASSRGIGKAGGMEILWPAMGIGVLVFFIFFVLAQHWQKILRHHSWTIQRLTGRVRDLEEMTDPEFLRRLNESAPVPLQQVFTFSFRLSDRFWSETLDTSAEDLNFIRASGSFLGSVRIEQWRGHAVVTVAEVLPESKAAIWQTRSLDFYPGQMKNGDAVSLWEMPLARARISTERPPSLELLLAKDSLELCAHLSNSGSREKDRTEVADRDIAFFRVPLDATRLAEFRSDSPVVDLRTGNGNCEANEISTNGSSWQAFYSHEDESLGVEWQLWLRDLSKRAEWERWKILESNTMPIAVGE
jgi:hypothetical protein